MRAYLWALVALLIIVGLAYGVELALNPTTPTIPPPPPTAADYTSAETSFQYLVTYNSQGFQPATVTVDPGQTVRFSNMSSQPIIVSGAGKVSPSVVSGGYWQYTASTPGSHSFQANDSTMQITVKTI